MLEAAAVGLGLAGGLKLWSFVQDELKVLRSRAEDDEARAAEGGGGLSDGSMALLRGAARLLPARNRASCPLQDSTVLSCLTQARSITSKDSLTTSLYSLL